MTEEEKVFKDPVHGYIYVHHPVVWDLINTREMQRLRRIRQLGTAYVTYPGGDHSRFSHSLGVYEVVRQIIAAFERNGYHWNTSQNLLVMVSGLLHDVGHGPFSHAVEKVVGLRHERWSEAIVLDPQTDVHQVLEAHGAGFSQEVADVIGKRHPDRLVTSLVSGQLDADRLDYLMRDSIATGVDYGKFDLARIIRIMEPLNDRIVVRKSGLHTLEAYLLARYFMYWQVYFHPVSRSAEIILRSILQRASDLVVEGKAPGFPHPALASLLTEVIGLDEYLRLDDAVFLNAFNVWQEAGDPILQNLCRRFLNRDLLAYRDYPREHPEWWQKVQEMSDRTGFDPKYYCAVDETSTVYYDYYLGREGSPDTAIWLWDRDRKQLSETSVLSAPIRTIAEDTRGARRVYFPKEINQQVEALSYRAD